jgi:ArsR family transcriptional regulator
LRNRTLDALLNALRAAGEPTRLRLLALLAHNELAVTELTQILGQSQPRVSRHLKLLADAGLVERNQEGTWAFYRLAGKGGQAGVARTLVEWIPADDPALERDLERLGAVRKNRAEAAAGYFRANAAQWNRIRSLHVDDSQVERAMLEAVGDRPIEALLDLGTGTGRILQVFSDRIGHGVGVDLSREMLAIARASLDDRRTRHCQVRQGDIYALPFPAGSMDVVTIHQVLHFLDDPAAAIAEAARMVRVGGQLLIVDFASHRLEFLRNEYAHRRLGFDDEEVNGWCEAAGLERITVRHLGQGRGGGREKLTVTLWSAFQNDSAPAHHRLEVA